MKLTRHTAEGKTTTALLPACVLLCVVNVCVRVYVIRHTSSI